MSKMTNYFIFGVNIASNFLLVKRVALLGSQTPELSFSCKVVRSLPNNRSDMQPVYISPYKTKDGENLLYVFQKHKCDVMHFPNVGDFYIWPDRIVCYKLEHSYRYLVEMWLVGTVLALWIERKGVPVMHASAIVSEDCAIGFLANVTAGKSSIAASLMQSGYALLTDDVLAVESRNGTFIGQPGYPQMRLWPDQAEHFVGCYKDLQLVHPDVSKRTVPVGPEGFGDFCDVPKPIKCLYIPNRRESGDKSVEITPVSPRDATIELVRYSFLTRILTKMGMQAHRLSVLARIAQQVPIRRITYPSGLEHLSMVRDKILEDVKSLPH